MPKPLAKQKNGSSAVELPSAHAAPEGTTGAAAAFRSPVGCTGATPGENDFLAWCSEERVRFPSSHLAILPDTGRALVASRNIKMGEVVVEVPDDAVLMADNCTIRDILEEEGMCKPADDEILEIQGLIIAVMYEKSRGKQSRWAPYLNVIPDDMTHMPLYWKYGEFQELRGTAAYDKMMGKVQCPADAPTQIRVLWSEVVEPFIQEHPELELPAGKTGYDLYRWATCAVASYSFILGDDKYQAMVPVWDLLNHITGQVNVRLYHCAKRHVLQMIATRDIHRGEELVNNYGELSNAELLRGYGFVEAHNSNNHAQVPLGFVVRAATELLGEDVTVVAPAEEAGAGPGPGPGSESDPAGLRARVAARLRLARRYDLLPQHHVFKVFEGRPPPSLMTALIHLLLASDADVAAVRAAARRAAAAAMEGADGEGRGKGKGKDRLRAGQTAAVVLQARTVAALAGKDTALARVTRVYDMIVQRMLGRYTCDLAEDERLLAEAGAGRAVLPPRLHAAVLARKPEKEALLSLRDSVQRKGVLRKSLAASSGTDLSQITFGRIVAAGAKEHVSAISIHNNELAKSCSNSTANKFAPTAFSFGFTL